MAKTAQPKRDPAANPRSRTARRATSPGINIDKSIRNAPRATDATPILGTVRGNGVSKKQKKKQMTRGQRIRQEKGLARAEAVMDQMIKKVDISKTRSKKIQQRATRWEDINGAAIEEIRQATTIPGRQDQVDDEWEDINDGQEHNVEMEAANGEVESIPPILATRAGIDTNKAPGDDVDLIS